jgi:hypothetical protein
MAAWERWIDAGPKPDDIIQGLGGFLPMSSGEVASIRMLATLADGGHRLLADWTKVVLALSPS